MLNEGGTLLLARRSPVPGEPMQDGFQSPTHSLGCVTLCNEQPAHQYMDSLGCSHKTGAPCGASPIFVCPMPTMVAGPQHELLAKCLPTEWMTASRSSRSQNSGPGAAGPGNSCPWGSSEGSAVSPAVPCPPSHEASGIPRVFPSPIRSPPPQSRQAGPAPMHMASPETSRFGVAELHVTSRILFAED